MTSKIHSPSDSAISKVLMIEMYFKCILKKSLVTREQNSPSLIGNPSTPLESTGGGIHQRNSIRGITSEEMGASAPLPLIWPKM